LIVPSSTTSNTLTSTTIKKMAVDRRYKSGKINKCSCGKVILHVETAKKKSKVPSQTPRDPPKCEPKGGKGLRAFSSFIKKNDKKVHAAGYDPLSETGPKQKKNLCIECAQKPKSEREPKRSTTERLQLVKVASSLTKKTFAKKHDISRTGFTSALPYEIIVIDEDRPFPNSTVALPIKNPSFQSARSEQIFDGLSPSTAMKRQPTIFTFDTLALSASSVDECLLVTSPEDEDKYCVDPSKSTILSDLAESEVTSTQEMSAPAIVPFLAEEASGQSHAPQNLFASTETPERVRLISEDSDMTSIKSIEDYEMPSIEFSEADFMKITARLDHCALQTPLHSTKAEPDTRDVVPSRVQEEDNAAKTTEVARLSQFPSWCGFKNFFIVS
jgi:hypothetical protein